jgi:hypothetical protein
MLGCWASSGDLASANACKEAAKRLHECMAKPVRFFLQISILQSSRLMEDVVGDDDEQKVAGKARVPSINYHLSRLGSSS